MGIDQVSKHDHSADDEGGDSISPAAVQTGALSGTYPSNLQVFTNGEIQSVDPANTTTPVQDAVDIAESNNGGEIRLPPGVIQESQTVNIERNVSIRGHGIGDASLSESRSVVEWPDGVNHIEINVGGVCLDGFTLRGPGPATNPIRSLGIGHGGTADPRNIQIGHLAFEDFRGRAVATSGSVFQSHLGTFLSAANIDAGDEVALFDLNFGFCNTMGNLSAYPTDDGSGSLTTIIRLGSDFGIEIGSINVGGTAESIVERRAGYEPLVIHQSNFEPTNIGTTSIDRVFNLENGPSYIYGTKVTGTSSFTSINKVYRLDFNSRKSVLTKPEIRDGDSGGFSVGQTPVVIQEDPFGYSWYFGPSSDITNNASTASGYVRSLESAGTGHA